MRMGMHTEALAGSLTLADQVYIFAPPDLDWDASAALAPLAERLSVSGAVEDIVQAVATEAAEGDHILVMSNGGFQGIHQRLLDALSADAPARGG
jgi:UDP-N-acetylmuramate: L-alanyl-gamma-D-glutamyl-meso-diaminopimelate ligase